ncbi:MAG: hypothetical protein ACKVX7_18390 [Planctomycetota bacterium]
MDNATSRTSLRDAPPAPHRIEIRLREIAQLFNSMDPSPFHEKDLDADAEEFILSWGEDFPVEAPIELMIHLDSCATAVPDGALLEQSVQHHFAYLADGAEKSFRRLLRTGRMSLAIGLLFLATCLLTGEVLLAYENRTFLRLLRESLSIAGWVAMWRPMEIFLYEWWPQRRRCRYLRKLAAMRVTITRGATISDHALTPLLPHHRAPGSPPESRNP